MAASLNDGGGRLLLAGKLANREIVFDLLAKQPENQTTTPEVPIRFAEYFYRHVGIVIPLVKEPNGWLAECTARFTTLDCDKPSGYWLLPDTPTGAPLTVNAKWKATLAGPVVNVELRAVDEPVDARLDSWTRLLGTGQTRLTQGAERNRVTVGVLSDTRSGVKAPQLVSGYPDETITRLNAQFRAQLISEAADALENSSLGGDNDENRIVQYQSLHWLVWGGGVGGYFGGSHPLYSFSFQVLDMRTGNPVDARTTLFKHLSDSELKKLAGSSTSFGVPATQFKGRRVIESLVFREIEARAARASQPGNGWDEQEQSCFEEFLNEATDASSADPVSELAVTTSSYDKKARFEFRFELMPSFEGLAVVSNSFSEASRACRGVVFTIPWGKVRPYLSTPL